MGYTRQSIALGVGTPGRQSAAPTFPANLCLCQKLRPPTAALRQTDEQGGDELRNFAAEVVLFLRCMLRCRRLELTVRQLDRGHRDHQLRRDLEYNFRFCFLFLDKRLTCIFCTIGIGNTC